MAEKGFALMKGRSYKGELKKRLVKLAVQIELMKEKIYGRK